MKGSEKDAKGFSGLSALSAKRDPSVVSNSDRAPEGPIPIASGRSEPLVAPRPQSQTAAPKWRGLIVTALCVLAGAGVIALTQQPSNTDTSPAIGSQPSSDATAAGGDQAAADAAQASADAAAVAADVANSTVPSPISEESGDGPREQAPGVGVDQVLYDPQIRYCVYEKIRLDAADRVVDSYNGQSVDRFNTMVNDYNSRCGSFKYRAGALEPIQREAEAIRDQLGAQGRDRFSMEERSSAVAPAPTLGHIGDDTGVSAQAPTDTGYTDNLNTCLSGSYPMLCKHESLSASDAERVASAEATKNYETCISGEYPMLCKHDRLTSEQAGLVEQAELAKNYETCISGRYPMLCKHEKLTPDQNARVEQAELDRNYETCISGRYPMLCKHELLTAEQAGAVAAAEGR